MAHYILAITLLTVPITVHFFSGDRAMVADYKYPVAFCLVPEMQYIPEVDSWDTGDDDDGDEIQVGKEHMDALSADWNTKRKWCREQVDSALVRSLSRWAEESMAAYIKVAAFDANLNFTPVSEHKKHGKIVFAGVIEELPSHSPIVKRNLILYILYDCQTKEILRVTLTIRGEAYE